MRIYSLRRSLFAIISVNSARRRAPAIRRLAVVISRELRRVGDLVPKGHRFARRVCPMWQFYRMARGIVAAGLLLHGFAQLMA